MKINYYREFVYTTHISVNFQFIAKMKIKPNSTSSETSNLTIILVDINIILMAVCPFFIERNARFEVLKSQLYLLK